MCLDQTSLALPFFFSLIKNLEISGEAKETHTSISGGRLPLHPFTLQEGISLNLQTTGKTMRFSI